MPTHDLPEDRRKAIFAALVEAQDAGATVAASRRQVAEQFGVTLEQVEAAEREGIARQWPPL